MDIGHARELNDGEDEDEALRRAIELSMGGAPSADASASRDVETATQIDLTGPDSPDATKPAGGSAPASVPAIANNPSSMLGLNRKKMEEERLARLQKRKAPPSPDGGANAPQQRIKRAGGPGGGIVPSYLSQAIAEFRTSQAAPDRAGGASRASSNDTGSTRVSAVGLPFPKGAVKKTWALGQPRTGDDIKIEEVLQKNELELAVLSSFQWHDEWLMSKLDLRRTKVVLVAFAADEAQKEQMQANVPGNRIRFCFPPMQGIGCMHSKLQLLKFPKYLRIVVPSGNLTNYDWGETGVMENMVFLIDLPRIKDEKNAATGQLTEFGEDLSYFLQAQGLDESLIKSLRNYDFSETARYGFVHTIGGSHSRDSWKRTGYCGLGRVVGSLGWRTNDSVEIDYLCSSIGAVNNDLLTALYNACQGDSGAKEYEARTNKPKKSKGGSTSRDPQASFKDRFRVYFPSHDTVVQSRGGKDAAGTITFQSRWWNSPTFPRGVLRDCRNVRQGLLMHSKMMFIRRRAADPSGWAYVGSANLSESAWGRLVRDRGTGQPKLTCRNWEAGVVIPAAIGGSAVDEPASGQTTGEGPRMLDVFHGDVPVPMQLPGASYCGDGDAKQPWFLNDR